MKKKDRYVDCWRRLPSGEVLFRRKKLTKKEAEEWDKSFEEMMKCGHGFSSRLSAKDRYGLKWRIGNANRKSWFAF